MCSYDNTNKFDCQSALKDEYISAKTGKTKCRPWRDKKVQNELLSVAYDSINKKKADRLRSCASVLTFRRYQDGTLALQGMNSCRVRLCPMCSWRRSLKNYYNNARICEYLDKTKSGAWLLLTLTVKNCSASELSSEIDNLMYSWKKFTKNTAVKAVIRGFYRGLEVTHDNDLYITKASFDRRKDYLRKLGLKVGDLNPTYDTYHPHFHALIYVNKSYFNSRYFMSVGDWSEAWRQALGVDYMPSVSSKRVKDDGRGIAASIAEVSKYATKSADYIYPDDWDLTVETVKTLDEALAGRRLIAYGGEVKEAFQALKLEDADTGDLINIGEEERTNETYEEVSYFWHTGYRQYLTK